LTLPDYPRDLRLLPVSEALNVEGVILPRVLAAQALSHNSMIWSVSMDEFPAYKGLAILHYVFGVARFFDS